MKRVLGWLSIVALFAAVLAAGPTAAAAERTEGSRPVFGQAHRSAVTPQTNCTISRGGHVGSYICDPGYWIEDIRYDNRCHTFITGTNRQVYYAWETTTASNAPCNNTRSQGGTWSNWHSLGGTAFSGVEALTSGSVLAIGVRGTDRNYCKSYTPSSGWSGWSPCV